MTLKLDDCSDGELAALALGGRQSAYTALLTRYREPVFRVVRATIGDTDAAVDVTQEAFVSAFAALKGYDSERPFKTWISRIAINKCRDWARRRAVRSFFTWATPIDDAFDLPSDAASPETETGDRAELRQVRSAIAALPTKLREVLVLRGVEGMTQAEAAQALDLTEKAVETRLYRARTQLKHLLSGTNERDSG